ncbi:MAG: hypothetical protein AUJ92_04955 [Armatimonadetes bacterium CG2_30_59_28]|nr:protein kinase [Armatimonadota bacterium]OIO96847.1 MAG: hypothetical protein AUJ92_04955 [Armatimonadetes bacterium CG2_30_59_28]PIU60556.1 MAG: hypothetical protein COS85_23835 [Armatimonadetes bacterium CG07_land_8_20_14_0_80_59_28]PIX44724.1 MAG: hypothetical protein COZ56_03935 [Armatimonadetes bacterium CG_4_8_14_3_um_filter_58_9]
MARRGQDFRYEAVDREGEGTLFVVYRARDKVLGKPVALKVLRQRYAEDVSFVENLKKAIQTTVDLPHRHIASVYSTGEEDGYVFMATEYVRGESLESRLGRDAPLSRKDALSLLIPICEAVTHAHQNGILHGDLRPRNVLIGGDGVIKVTDFALSSAFAHSKVTLAETIPDASRYTAPEVAEGSAVSIHSDLYSLGIIAYQMFTATVPFDGKSPTEILGQHVSRKPPPPSNFSPGISPAIEEVILKLLSKDPKERYPSVSHLIQDLRQIDAGGRPGEGSVDWGSATLQRPKRTSAREQVSRPGGSIAQGEGSSSAVWSLATILASILLMLGAYSLWVATTPKEVAVPDVKGIPLREAADLLESVGLTLTEARKEFHPEVAEGCIIDTMPAAGRKVKQGRTINAIVSRGQKRVLVPDLRDMPLDKARKVLSDAKLSVGKVQEVYSPIIAKGLVVSQAPGPTESVTERTPIWIQVSRGPEPSIPATEPNDDEGAVPRDAQVTFDVPQGPSRQEVKIMLRDAKGERTVYQQMRRPGDQVDETVEIYGAKAIIRVFLAGNLVAEEER